VVTLAWLGLVRLHDGESAMSGMAGMDMAPAPWTMGDAALAFAMWAVMMPAMMLPSAAPMILMFIEIARRRAGGLADLSTFVAGYLAVWTSFSAVATAGQWALHAATFLSGPVMALTPRAGGVVLILAGAYQLTPLKRVCLTRCQSPVAFLLGAWRDGTAGAFLMGAQHGLFCVGCCWALMALLFAGGVMNLVWVAVIAAFVLVEKALPLPRAVGWVSGAALVVWGLVVVSGRL
jgi:predicted metal-binding membrane protein